jgi:lysophospholipase L1-like esterase
MAGKVFLKDLVKVVTATIIFLVVVESLLRVAYFIRNAMVDYVVLPYNAAQDFGPVPSWLDGLRILKPDDVLFWKGRSNLSRRYLDVYSPVQREEDRTVLLRQFIPNLPESIKSNPVWEVSLNSMGFREKEFSSKKASSTFRIVCIGDSWTFGANVDQKYAYPQRLGALLKQEFPGANFEVLNLGVLAYSSYQGLGLLKTTIGDLAPDMVLIGFGMNDASVAGYRDKDMLGYKKEQPSIKNKMTDILKRIEIYKLMNYLALVIKHKPFSIGDYMRKVAPSADTPDEAWVGKEGNEIADYDKLEPYTRVSPTDYEKNVVEMIDLAKSHGADVILLYNELWSTPYRMVLENISKAKGVALVDSKALIERGRTRIEQDLEQKLDLRPPKASLDTGSEEIEVVFRVYSGEHPVPKSLYIAGMHPKLGDGVPNQIAMYDDGTHGDQRGGDKVWSYAATFSPGTTLLYVYTNSGENGRWEGLDIPEVRRYTVKAAHNGKKLYRPIESFGEMYMQADGWHTNAAGYELIAQSLLQILKQNRKVNDYVEKMKAQKH